MFLVTGGAGFIGHHLTRRLALHNQVIVIDNMSSYYSLELKKMRVEQLVRNKNVVFIELDLNDQARLASLFRQYPISVVVNLAAQPGVRIPLKDYGKYVESNLNGFEVLMQTALNSGVSNVIFASSSSVYGDSSEYPLSEEQKVLNPKSYYGATKLCNEITARLYSSRHGLKIYGLRFFTVYGPWGRPDMAYFRIASAILNNEPFKLFGDGSVVRDFTFVDDVIESIERLSRKLTLSEPGTFELFNIGGGKPSSMKDLIREFEVQSGMKLQLELQEPNRNDVATTDADWNKLIQYSGFRPQISLSEGVALTLDWAKSKEIKMHLSSWAKSVQ